MPDYQKNKTKQQQQQQQQLLPIRLAILSNSGKLLSTSDRSLDTFLILALMSSSLLLISSRALVNSLFTLSSVSVAVLLRPELIF